VTRRIVKQGTLAEAYASMGGEILVVGKPSAKMFRHALDRLAMAGGESTGGGGRHTIAMVGDTLDTDILGAINASGELGRAIDGVLVLTGLTADDMAREISGTPSRTAMEKFFAARGIIPTHVMAALAPDAEVYL
jgi:ribonucleotide monophosphatase NagD (HAD superfamily)